MPVKLNLDGPVQNVASEVRSVVVRDKPTTLLEKFTAYYPPAVVYLLAYAALDGVSAADSSFPLRVSFWNPIAGLDLVLLIYGGWRYLPLVLTAHVLTDLMFGRELHGWNVEIGESLVLGLASASAALFLQKSISRFDAKLPGLRDVVLLIVAAAISALLAAFGNVMLEYFKAALTHDQSILAFRMFGVGHFSGIASLAPLLLIVLGGQSRLRASSRLLSLGIALGVIVLALALVRGQDIYNWFFLLSIPVAWMALIAGVEGACLGLLAVQMGIVLHIGAQHAPTDTVGILQTRVLVLCLTTLAIGVLMSERRKFEQQVRQHQEALFRLGRIGSMGEVAAAIAHEINQPLMAAGTYMRLVETSLASAPAENQETVQIARKAVEQVDRAAEVIRNIRALTKLDRSGRLEHQVPVLVENALKICRIGLEQRHISCRVAIQPDLPSVYVIGIQIEQVLVNLIQNAADAVAPGRGSIVISAVPLGRDMVEVTVSDNGTGFPEPLLDGESLLFWTTKIDGNGIGLSLSRSIIEAHEGEFRLENVASGAVVRFTLPIAGPFFHD